MRRIKILTHLLILTVLIEAVQAQKFEAVGNSNPNHIAEPRKVGEVVVNFDMVPTQLSFDMPSFPSMVMENGFKYSNFWTETYDSRNWDGAAGLASFETLMDQNNRYARMWIEYQSDARIVVRVRGALCNSVEAVAHPDIESKSPYGEGDWVDEWFYIYPDGLHTRHIKIYTGLADRSRPFGLDRDPPKVVHEFMESAIFGMPGQMPTDILDTSAVTLIRMIGDNVNNHLTHGESKTISFSPYPSDFGEFRDANIWLINMRSTFKPFVIGMPYGARSQPYMLEEDPKLVFQTWGDPLREEFTCGLGHLINYWHFRRTDYSLEQVYLQGTTNTSNPQEELTALGWSWIANPILYMETEGERKQSYNLTYSHEQKAYIVPSDKNGAQELAFTLEADEDIGEFGAANWIINPAFVVKGWGNSGVKFEIDNKEIKSGNDFRIGYESTQSGVDLILWVRMKTSETTKFNIIPN